jgi:two-component system CheB/CheR fusion protein
LHLAAVDLKTIVTQAVEMSRPLCIAKGHALSVSMPPHPLPLRADTTRLTQVFANLLNNAAKYCDPGGRITLTVEQQGSEAVVRVRDTGHGIDRETLPYVFDLFVQGGSPRGHQESGLGIGLTLVRRLVEMHGGMVQADSDGPGKGSEFVVRLPLSLLPAAHVPPRSPDVPKTRELPKVANRILVVDDNVDAAQSLVRLLKTDGHEAWPAFSGAAAVEMAASQRPDIILLDIGLPDMDGYEVARHIRSRSEGGDVVLVAITGCGQPDDRQRAVQAGINHHLMKPVEYGSLSELLAQLGQDRQSAGRPLATP